MCRNGASRLWYNNPAYAIPPPAEIQQDRVPDTLARPGRKEPL